MDRTKSFKHRNIYFYYGIFVILCKIWYQLVKTDNKMYLCVGWNKQTNTADFIKIEIIAQF